MAEPLPEPITPQAMQEPPDALVEGALARKNIVWGWALFGLFGVLFGGTFGIAFVYLWLS